MKGSVWLGLRRATAALAVFSAVSWAMATSPTPILIFNAQDRVKFLLAAAGLGALAPRLGRALASPRWTSVHTHTATLACGLMALAIAAMSSSTWRIGGQGVVIVDGPARVVFNNLYLLLEVGILVTAVPVDAADAADKWIKIGKVLLAVAVLMLAVAYADQIPTWLRPRTELHDASPLGPDTDGRP